jgi:hypothetical protein
MLAFAKGALQRMEDRIMETGMPTKCGSPTRRTSPLTELRLWYRRWVRIREARYRYLEAILDGRDVQTLQEPSRAQRECQSSGDRA